MRKLNNKGFAISAMLYGVLLLAITVMLLIMSTMAFNKKTGDDMVAEVENQLLENSLTATYSYTGSEQIYNVTKDGYYHIQLWGASGGDYGIYKGGNGAYTSGYIQLSTGTNLYFYIGAQGPDNGTDYTKPYNGGGLIRQSDNQGLYGRSGGGATDVRLTNGQWNDALSLTSRIMIAAGGGGANNRNSLISSDKKWYGAGNGGSGGTLIGISGQSPASTHTGPGGALGWGYGTGATQKEGGVDTRVSTSLNVSTGTRGIFGMAVDGGQSGGGGGYYGGGYASLGGGGGGGSSYISGQLGCIAIEASDNSTAKGCSKDNIECSYHYSNFIFKKTSMINGDTSMPNKYGGSNTLGNNGNGYAKISYVGTNLPE